MLAFCIVLVIVLAVAEAVSVRFAFKGIRYDTTTSKTVVDPDEKFDILTTVENAKRLPVGYIKVEETLPASAELELYGQDLSIIKSISSLSGSMRIADTFYLRGGRRMERRITASLPKRGRYFFYGAVLYVGDLLGLREQNRPFKRSREGVVVPKPSEDVGKLEALGGFLGERSINRFIMEDPVLTIGFREYTGRDPMKAISWKQSARMGRLMVKNYDHTLEPAASVLLSVHGGSREAIEECFSLARSVCEKLEEQAVKYSFQTNATAAGAMGLWSRISEGLGTRHLMAILEGLGRANYDCTESFDSLLLRSLRTVEGGRMYIIITPDPGVTEAAVRRTLGAMGTSVLLLKGGC